MDKKYFHVTYIPKSDTEMFNHFCTLTLNKILFDKLPYNYSSLFYIKIVDEYIPVAWRTSLNMMTVWLHENISNFNEGEWIVDNLCIGDSNDTTFLIIFFNDDTAMKFKLMW